MSSKVYQYAFINLGDAFKRFFKKLGGYPKFKKKGRHDRFTIDNSGAPIKLGGTRHKLPFIGWVNTHEVLPECTEKKVSISRQAGCWYISFAVEVPETHPAQMSGRYRGRLGHQRACHLFGRLGIPQSLGVQESSQDVSQIATTLKPQGERVKQLVQVPAFGATVASTSSKYSLGRLDR